MLRRIEMNWIQSKMQSNWKGTTLKWIAVAGALVALIVASAIVLNSVVATPASPREGQIRVWVSNLRDEGLTTSRHQAQTQLEAAGDEAVPSLLTALRSNDPILRRNAADVLGYIGSPRATDALKATLGADPVPAVRANAAWALGQIKAVSAVNLLERASVADTSAQVRALAGEALDRVRSDLAARAGVPAENVDAIAVAPDPADLVYLAARRDLLVSRDGGAQWETFTQALPGLTATLTVNPTNSEIVFAGFHSQGMYLSTDGGQTWQSLTRNFSNEAIGQSTVTAIAVDPANPMQVVMAHGIRIGTGDPSFVPLGILSSRDGGQTWGYVLDLEQDQWVTRLSVRENKVYALTDDRVLIASLEPQS